MRIRLILVTLMLPLLFLQCSQKDCCVMPEFAEFNGNWRLEKIVNGFAQLELKGDKIGFKETLEIDGTASNFKRIRDNAVLVNSSVSLGTEYSMKALILKNNQTYHWYSFQQEDNKTYLVLYENCPIGAQLADGSYYFYKKE